MAEALIHQLVSTIQNYTWGSRRALAALQGRPVPTDLPEAELWMGAHPRAPSTIIGAKTSLSLPALISMSPAETLGPSVAARFDGQLPFLVKLLCVAAPLSIQIHPNSAQALAGFAEEDARQVPIEAPERHYRDRNHKPELVCALTDFHAFCGFRDVAELQALARCGLPPEIEVSIARLAGTGDDAAFHGVLSSWLRLPRAECRRLLAALRLSARRIAGERSELAPAFTWIARLLETYDDDPGVLAALLLRHIHIRSGEAFFIDAGVLHTYLEGTAVEVMANSDNVIRGGLTPKHVDVEGLLGILGPSDARARLITPREVGVERIYDTPAREFRLSRFDVEGSPARFSTRSAEIVLCSEGALVLSSRSGAVQLGRGAAAFVSASATEYSVAGPGAGFRVVVPALA